MSEESTSAAIFEMSRQVGILTGKVETMLEHQKSINNNFNAALDGQKKDIESLKHTRTFARGGMAMLSVISGMAGAAFMKIVSGGHAP